MLPSFAAVYDDRELTSLSRDAHARPSSAYNVESTLKFFPGADFPAAAVQSQDQEIPLRIPSDIDLDPNDPSLFDNESKEFTP